MKKNIIAVATFCFVFQALSAQKTKKTTANQSVSNKKEITNTATQPEYKSFASKSYYFKEDPKMDAFISNLISQMTLEEKLGQLNLPSSGDIVTGATQSSDIGKQVAQGKVGGLFNINGFDKIKAIQKVAVEQSRLKIPLLIGKDVIHGYVTNFPIPLGLASSWDLALIEKSAQIAAAEATADGVAWTFSPMVDVSRDPRWGRVAEGAGEDPFLGSAIAQAMVQGYQGRNLADNNTMLACVKHFALYGAAEGGRDYNTVDMSRVRMFNEYFSPYKAAIDAGVGSVMASFNEVEGIPATGNKWLQTDVLRNQWKFPGFVVTDYTGINEMINHGMGDLQQVSALALNAGVDMDMVGDAFLTTLKKSLDEGKVSQESIDQAVRRILEAKYRLGLFEDPYKYNNDQRNKTEIYSQANRDVARNISAQSMVLLENKNNILPLKKSGTIALIGPLGDAGDNMPGTWAVSAWFDKAISLKKGLEETVGKEVKILTAKGSFLENNETIEKIYGKRKNFTRDGRTKEQLLQEAIEVAKKSDVIVMAIGEASEMSGEASSRKDISVPQAQRDLLTEMKKIGKPIIIVLFDGRPMELNQEKTQADALLNVWSPGSEAGYAISDVLFGEVNPSAKLPASFPRSVGQVPIYYNHKNTGRPAEKENIEQCKYEEYRSVYMDECNTPLYPFGYGLSYTTFTYSNISLSSTSLTGNQTLNASVTISNSGKYDGAEVVQLYIRDKVGSITRPVQELKGFQKIYLKKGESKTVSFEITPELLKFYNNDLKYDWESGEFEIQIGTNSHDVKSGIVNWTK